MKKHLFILNLIFTFIFFSCSFYSEKETLVISFPDSQKEWHLVKRVGEAEENFFLEAGQKVECEFDRNKPTSLLAYLDGEERPLGAIYPYSIRLQEKDGFAASVLYSLYCQSKQGGEETAYFLCRFNWQKFMESCRQKAEDPWSLDKERIMKAIASGHFSLRDIRAVEKNK